MGLSIDDNNIFWVTYPLLTLGISSLLRKQILILKQILVLMVKSMYVVR